MPDPTIPPSAPPRRRRRLVFSVRALLALVALVAAPLGWWSHRAHEQAAAVAAIRLADPLADIEYNNKDPVWVAERAWDDEFIRSRWVPIALEHWAGIDYFFQVRYLRLSDGCFNLPPAECRRITDQLGRLPDLRTLILPIPVDDAAVVPLGRMGSLRQLFPGFNPSPDLTDRSLRVIGRLPELESLTINDASLTDVGVAWLDRLDRLRELTLGHPHFRTAGRSRMGITGSGFAGLGRLPDLTHLEIHSPALTGAGLRGIGGLAHLTDLTLDRIDQAAPSVADDDLRFLAPLALLQDLRIEGFGIDGTGFRHLGGLAKLTSVYLLSPNTSDAATPFLARLPGLRSFGVRGHKLTAQGLQAFRAAPNLRSIFGDPAIPGSLRNLRRLLPQVSLDRNLSAMGVFEAPDPSPADSTGEPTLPPPP